MDIFKIQTVNVVQSVGASGSPGKKGTLLINKTNQFQQPIQAGSRAVKE
jgi:hypothetical protein